MGLSPIFGTSTFLIIIPYGKECLSLF